jgi:integrase
MASQELTDLTIRALEPRDKQYDVWDANMPGLMLRVSPSGTKAFCFSYRYRGKEKRRKTIGRYPKPFSLADARKEAKALAKRVANGEDPARANKVVSTDKGERPFSDVAAEFVDQYAKPRNRRWWETERILKKDFKTWNKWPINTIHREHVQDVLKTLKARSAKGTAANAGLAVVRKLFNWAVDENYIAISPCLRITKPTKSKSRDRVLSDRELARVWLAADAMGWPYGRIIQLLILTGQRRQEVAGIRWEELNAIKTGVWSIPAGRTKADRAHELPFSKTMAQIVSDLPQRHGELAFPAFKVQTKRAAWREDRTGLRPVSGFSWWKAQLDEKSGVKDWRVHDLRRTLSTRLAGMKIPQEVTERILNHKTGILGGVAGIYNRFGYEDEMADALQKWAEYVQTIVEAEKARLGEVKPKITEIEFSRQAESC